MKFLKNPAVTLLSAILMLMAASCSDDCTENKNALPLAGFYSSTAPSTKIRVDSLQVEGYGAPGDSILSRGDVTKDEVYLPFRIDSDTTVYLFRYMYADLIAENVVDTVRFIYTRTPRFVSAECGVSYQFDIRKITSTGLLIDSVVCPNGYIDNTNSENLRIYFAINSTEE